MQDTRMGRVDGPVEWFESEARALAETYGVRWLILLVFPPLVLSYYADRDTCLSSILRTGTTGCETHNLGILFRAGVNPRAIGFRKAK